MKKSLILVIVLILSAPVWAGTKEEIIRLQIDVVAVQNQIRLLQKSIDENGGITKTLLNQLLEMITKTQQQVNDIKNNQDDQARSRDENIEDVVNEIRNLAAKVEDLSGRLAAVTKKVDATQQALQDMVSRRPTPETGPDGKPLPLPPDKLYSLAYNDYIQGNYELAIQGFLDFLALYKDSELADNAQYYIGDCYFNQGNYEDAIKAFAQVSTLFSKGDKAPAAMLKSGLAYLNMKDNQSAIKQFQEVINKYPDSPEANIATQQLQILGVEPPAKSRRNP